MDITDDIEGLRTPGPKKKYLTQQDVEAIKIHAARGMTVSELASIVSVSKSSFYNMLQEEEGLRELINRAKALAKSKVAKRAYDRALDDDKSNRFWLTHQGGWAPARADGVTINNSLNIQNNEQNNSINVEYNAFEGMSKEEIEHYRNLPPEKMLAILNIKNPSMEPEAPLPHKNFPVEKDKSRKAFTLDKPEQNEIAIPEKATKKSIIVENNSPEHVDAVKNDLFHQIIKDNFRIVEIVKGTPNRKQSFLYRSTIDDILAKEYKIKSNNDRSAFYRYLTRTFPVKDARLHDPISKERPKAIVGMKLKKR